ncbi:hypothetical protein A2662_01815 [Candidatus Giovannonibacteria bacterium RIFCSPHIGHO2_01_FULL_45_33]|uniref:Uncharacterized protein n=1 Tax=Candidatus Giovannonibacteria bacterium RIFCSPLOWO2_01_FULL_45_34 TaxID=1798351 RepID=A0A1F5WYS0_9BACT|nr:MAG: hypothetical protein A2662_01815 [Candidatus Giovannonibacteria bacterium RIFCSPHIGHO2_01_FULL_45_33]OGF71000.1 MAG: hypothetical protein A3C73_04230 [Candidatus Giovannonibacteria bacterium RIFCSPHIGHO2_02_FULL_44_11]OGF80802.1 MAG: hypothetical protein A2930_01580 [Candidatus Giovannonibacteria bacterium RIFCSPLOWO2_01_FULL_45_34]
MQILQILGGLLAAYLIVGFVHSVVLFVSDWKNIKFVEPGERLRYLIYILGWPLVWSAFAIIIIIFFLIITALLMILYFAGGLC